MLYMQGCLVGAIAGRYTSLQHRSALAIYNSVSAVPYCIVSYVSYRIYSFGTLKDDRPAICVARRCPRGINSHPAYFLCPTYSYLDP